MALCKHKLPGLAFGALCPPVTPSSQVLLPLVSDSVPCGVLVFNRLPLLGAWHSLPSRARRVPPLLQDPHAHGSPTPLQGPHAHGAPMPLSAVLLHGVHFPGKALPGGWHMDGWVPGLIERAILPSVPPPWAAWL